MERLINVKISDRTGFTPATIMFGRPNALEFFPCDVIHVCYFLESISKFQAVLIAKHVENFILNNVSTVITMLIDISVRP